MAGTLLLVVWLVRWRVAVARAGLQRVYRARIGERERIARDLHDTLLQSMQGLLFLVEAARGRLDRGDGEAARSGLSRAVQEANAGLIEGRDRIRDLRQQTVEVQDLDAALGDLAERLAFPTDIAYAFTSRGKVIQLPVAMADEVYRIAREAVTNALRHAGAKQISVRLRYGWLGVLLEIEDDGCGIDDALLASGSRNGHWGLTGMRERARLLGGKLTLKSRAGAGTVVRLWLPRWRRLGSAGD